MARGTSEGTGTLGGNGNILIGHGHVIVAGRNGRASEGDLLVLVFALVLLGQLGSEGVKLGFFDRGIVKANIHIDSVLIWLFGQRHPKSRKVLPLFVCVIHLSVELIDRIDHARGQHMEALNTIPLDGHELRLPTILLLGVNEEDPQHVLQLGPGGGAVLGCGMG